MKKFYRHIDSVTALLVLIVWLLSGTNTLASNTNVRTNNYQTKSATADTIFSTTTGGNWNETSTWEGGVVPTANDDVSIEGIVTIDASSECKSLTIKNEKKLNNDNSAHTFIIHGNMTNHGSVDAFSVNFEIKGNLYLDGYSQGTFKMNGTTDQEVRYVSTAGYNRPILLLSDVTGSSYQWYKDNTAITNATSSSYEVITSASVETADYKCVVDGTDSRTIKFRWGAATPTTTINGKVTNALDGTGIAGALVEIAGLTTTTDANGNYEITDIPEAVLKANFSGTPTSGNVPLVVNFSDESDDAAHTLTVSANDFNTYINSQVVIATGETLNIDVSLSPVLSEGEIRIVLNWGSTPSDLDAHLKTPAIDGTEYHIYYGNKGNATAAPYATLDYDDRTSYGPETMTIAQQFTGTYKYYVYNYSGTPDITTSNAVVQVYGSTGLITSVNIPTTGTGRYWNVLTLDGSTGQVSVVNEIVESAPVVNPPETKVKPPLTDLEMKTLKASSSIKSWSWDFGDGTTSTEQNPSHTYTTAGNYTVKLTIDNGTTTSTETKTSYITANTSAVSAIKGLVTDAVTGNAIAGATVKIAGLTATTDANGNYEITDIPEAVLTAAFTGTPVSGNSPLDVSFTDRSTDAAHILEVSATDYNTYVNNQVAIGAGETLTMDVSLSPTLSDGEFRIVLNWGENPKDIDAHLKTPSIDGTEYHIYYSNKGNATAAPYATLDHDDRTSYGPETVTIYDLFAGTYKYYVYNYSGSPDIVTSNAVVQVYNSTGLIKTVNIPTTGTGRYWNVLTIDGSTGQVTVINEISGTAPVVNLPEQSVKPPLNAAEEKAANSTNSISSWSWNFGDGSTSTEQNPTHTYSSAGTYTVQLTVGNGTTTDTESKTDYITVSQDTPTGPVLFENFDGETFVPANWSQSIVNTSYTWKKGNVTDNSFSSIDPSNVYSAICPWVDQDQDEWLFSPTFSLSGSGTLEFYAGYSTDYLSFATLKLNITTDGGSNWTQLWEAEDDNSTWSWHKISVDLSSYSGNQNIKLGWQYVGNNGDVVAIDSVLIKEGVTGVNDLFEEEVALKNYPNPFSNQTTISFSLTDKKKVKLEIINVLGKVMDVLVDDELSKGRHSVIYNTHDGVSGIYFYRLSVGDKSIVRKMMRIK